MREKYSGVYAVAACLIRPSTPTVGGHVTQLCPLTSRGTTAGEVLILAQRLALHQTLRGGLLPTEFWFLTYLVEAADV